MCLGGALVFGSVLVMTFSNRPGLERAGATFLIGRVERELGAHSKIGAPGAFVDQVMRNLPSQAKELTVPRADRLQEIIRPATAEDQQIATRGSAAYRQLWGDLLHEVRVFAACNFVLFAFATLLAIGRKQDTRYLVLPAGILAGSTCLAVVSYLVLQDWVWTFLTGGYIGFWYILVVGTAASLLADVACNRARVSSIIARALLFWPG